ncbi:MAG TPA: 2Fe-2S iron-sulfur cluster-binding protein [Pyrinomonadaceae bacterium]|jgi:NADH dehydrogenase/NADH:ubiquinone oxidoreductase subunit G|nr:2Fe-2S iron-sulfur cluster-binding protein [Pyrinomonadaceae bacterium]
MNENDIFEPYQRLIEIEICGKTAEVPENNTLLRCFQFLSLESVSMGDFCWNGDCANCQVWLETKGSVPEKPVLACRTKVQENMKIVRMSNAIEITDN